MPNDVRSSLINFVIQDEVVGKVDPKTANLLVETKSKDRDSVFMIEEDDTKTLKLSPEVENSSFDDKTAAVNEIMEALRDDGIIKGWRDELYPVGSSYYTSPLMLMERAAVSLFGILEYGVHINGLVKQQKQGDPPLMWMARRSPTKSKFPNMLDHIVAGGQPAGLSLIDNVIKECEEEAGIPEHLAKAGITSTGAISYETYSNGSNGNGLGKVSRVILFTYDLYLPNDFQPIPCDGEVDEFFKWDNKQLFESMDPNYPDPIKPNCYVVIIDYLLRNGYLNQSIPGYLDILKELRSGDCK